MSEVKGSHPDKQEGNLGGIKYAGEGGRLPAARRRGKVVKGPGMTGPGFLITEPEPATPSAGNTSEDVQVSVAPQAERTTRPWEEVLLDPGTNVERKLLGRTYTVGEDHPLIDIWNFPPDSTSSAKRIATIRGCRLFILKDDKPKKKEKDKTKRPLNSGWKQMLVFNGVSKPKSAEPEVPVNFAYDAGHYKFVYAQWSDIKRDNK